MRNIILYMHGGSENHGCEAIVRSTYNILGETPTSLYSLNPDQDVEYGLNKFINILDGRAELKRSFLTLLIRILNKLMINNIILLKYRYSKYFKNDKSKICLSIGGDNYCCFDRSILAFLNSKAKKLSNKTVLWGCSIEPDLFKNNKSLIMDLNKYDLIIARESITYNALIEANINKNTCLYPDPAFTLETENITLPEGFIDKNTIGLNVSPLITRYEKDKYLTISNYTALIKHIINTTDMQIALIPHVIWKDNDDRILLKQLYDRFKNTKRLVFLEDHNCMELKGFISHCRMFIGARTHATIAAYSTCVPTLVVGYSVKSKGIAKDIFGTYENYVLPVQSLQNEDDLINAFKWLYKNENDIRLHLQNFMPSYIKKAWQAGDEIKKMIGEIKA